MRRFAIPTILAIVALLSAGLANAEFSQTGNLRLAFGGRIAPKKLPRTGTAPVTVRISGAIGTADGTRPPRLTKVAIAFNRYGSVSTAGLPTCDESELEQTTSDTARERCGSALVGQGKFKANVDFSGHEPVVVSGDMLAFNAKKAGKPALLLHVYGSHPVQLAFVLTFRIIHVKKGTFGTIFVAHIPNIASQLGLRHQRRSDLRPPLHVRRQAAELPERQVRGPVWISRCDLHPRPRQLHLQQRTAHQQLAGPQLLGPLAARGAVPAQARRTVRFPPIVRRGFRTASQASIERLT